MVAEHHVHGVLLPQLIWGGAEAVAFLYREIRLWPCSQLPSPSLPPIIT